MTPTINQKIMMQVNDIGVSYRQNISFMKSIDFWPIKGVTFDLYKGETLGIVGKNGAGKSTLLKVIARIIDADKGFIDFNGHSVSLLGLLLGFTQDLSGIENAIINGMLQGLSKSKIESRLDDIQEFSELGDFFYQPVKNYSAGMRARLRFAIAMQANPDILLIDELLGVGDTSFKRKSAKVIKDRIKHDQTAVVVSHDMSILRELCTRVVWIDDGETRMHGGADEVIFEYENSHI